MQKLSDSQVPAVLPLLFKIMDVNMLCWNIYLLVTAVVLGWIFSSKDLLDLPDLHRANRGRGKSLKTKGHWPGQHFRKIESSHEQENKKY